MSDKVWDNVIIGAGLGGLMSAALIRSRFPDRSVLLLESHTDVGGCAGCFERTISLPGHSTRQRVRFDVGATTLSGLGSGQSLRRLVDELSIRFPSSLADPGLCVVMNDGTRITRHADPQRWYEESARHFGSESIRLWHVLESIEQASWKLLVHFPRFPPASIRDALSLLKPQAILGLSALKSMLTPFSELLAELGLDKNTKLRAFLDQLLLVSTQTTTTEVSLLGAALGLIYPSQTYYLEGGAYTLSNELLKRYLELGGEIKFKHRVDHIDPKAMSIHARRAIYWAKRIISNATLWDTTKMLGDPVQAYFHTWDRVKDGDDVWGANTYYAVVDDTVGNESLFHQLHCNGGSFFVSLSRVGDLSKAPAGYRTLTVSTHEPDPRQWFGYSEDEYIFRKSQLQEQFESTLTAKLQGFDRNRVFSVFVSTPRSFEFYTRRSMGLVGGIAYKSGRLPWHWPSPVSPINGLYLVGDTIFPGQSAGAIAQCAISLVSRL